MAGKTISENGEVDFREITSGEYMMQQDKVAEQNAANVDYLAMMTGVDLPIEEAVQTAEAAETSVSTGDIEGEDVYDDTVDDPAYVETEEEVSTDE